MQAIIFCGIQGSGKSTFYQERFVHTHVRISLDLLRTRHREALILRTCLATRQSFVIDNTNATRRERDRYVAPALEAGFRATCCYFETPVRDAIARNLSRPEGRRVPAAGVYGTFKRLEPPTKDEGFAELFRVAIAGKGAFTVEPWTGQATSAPATELHGGTG